eukprot:gene17437-5649_t
MTLYGQNTGDKRNGSGGTGGRRAGRCPVSACSGCSPRLSARGARRYAPRGAMSAVAIGREWP